MSEETETTTSMPSEPEATTTLEPTSPTPIEPAAPEPVIAPEPIALESLKLPEGLEANDAISSEFLGLINNSELSREALAQGLIDLQGKVISQASEANSTAWDNLQEEWQGQVKADPEVGGAKFQATMDSIGKFMDQYGSDELREALNVTGAGNHPAVVKFFNKLSGILNEGGPVSGSPTSAPRTAAETLYPSMAKGA